jgi:prepilin-type N-terminal cleavage/methylation domain-containing protein
MKRGFTLIELLVVIAIIGILSSVVLASLNSARAKGQQAAVKSNLANMRAQAALFYDNNGSKYPTTLCTSDSVVTSASTSISNSGSAMTCTTDGDQKFVMVASLPGGTGANAGWCIDSNGYSGFTASTSASASGAPCK